MKAKPPSKAKGKAVKGRMPKMPVPGKVMQAGKAEAMMKADAMPKAKGKVW